MMSLARSSEEIPTPELCCIFSLNKSQKPATPYRSLVRLWWPMSFWIYGSDSRRGAYLIRHHLFLRPLHKVCLFSYGLLILVGWILGWRCFYGYLLGMYAGNCRSKFRRPPLRLKRLTCTLFTPDFVLYVEIPSAMCRIKTLLRAGLSIFLLTLTSPYVVGFHLRNIMNNAVRGVSNIPRSSVNTTLPIIFPGGLLLLSQLPLIDPA